MPKLTDCFLASFKPAPGKKDRLAFDTECRGLGVRTTAAGTRTFIVQWTDPVTTQKRREPLGVWGGITVDQAREAARARLGDVARGIDPRAVRLAAREEAEAERAEAQLTLGTLVDDWARLHLAGRRPRYKAEAVRAITRAFADHMRRPAARLTRTEAVAVLLTGWWPWARQPSPAARWPMPARAMAGPGGGAGCPRQPVRRPAHPGGCGGARAGAQRRGARAGSGAPPLPWASPGGRCSGCWC